MNPICTIAFCVIVYSLHQSEGIAPLTKVYKEFKTIDLVVPSSKGFHIILSHEFANNFLNKPFQPTVFTSATEVTSRSNATFARRTDFGENLSRSNSLRLSGLQPKTWYYLCIEFEISARTDKTTSTDCRLVKTLNDRGDSGHEKPCKLKILDGGSDFLEFGVEVDTASPARVTAFLEKGSRPAQVFLVTELSELEVYFGELNAGTNFGRFCAMFEPLVETYTMLGRSIQLMNVECYDKTVETEK